MKDFVPLGTGNSRNLKSAVPAGTTWEQALAMLRNGTFPIDIGAVNDAGVAQKGDPLNQETLLKAAVAALYGREETAVPSDIFEILSKAALYENGVIKDVIGENALGVGNCKIELTSYLGTGTESVSITFSGPAKFVFILDKYLAQNMVIANAQDSVGMLFRIGSRSFSSLTSISTSGNTVTINSASSINVSGRTHSVLALLQA